MKLVAADVPQYDNIRVYEGKGEERRRGRGEEEEEKGRAKVRL